LCCAPLWSFQCSFFQLHIPYPRNRHAIEIDKVVYTAGV
jgi:hypothetical protein